MYSRILGWWTQLRSRTLAGHRARRREHPPSSPLSREELSELKRTFYLTCAALALVGIFESLYRPFPLGVPGVWGDPVQEPAWDLCWLPLPFMAIFVLFAWATLQKIEECTPVGEVAILGLGVLLAFAIQLCVLKLGVAGSLGQAARLRHRVQAGRLQRASKRVQLAHSVPFRHEPPASSRAGRRDRDLIQQ